MADTTLTFIGAAISAIGALFAFWKSHQLEHLKGDIALDVGKQLEATKAALAKELAANESALRVAAERQLGVFKLAAESAEAAMRCLRDWEAAILKDMADVDSRRLEELSERAERAEAHRQLAQRTGLFLPPQLDAPYDTAWLALKVASESVGRHFALIQFHPGQDAREFVSEAIRDRTKDVRGAREAVEAFAAATREWKRQEWGGAEPAEEQDKESHQLTVAEARPLLESGERLESAIAQSETTEGAKHDK